MKNNITNRNNYKSSYRKKPYKIIKVSQEELELSMKQACKEMEAIKEANRSLINYQHKLIDKK